MLDLVGKRTLRDLLCERAGAHPHRVALVVDGISGRRESFTYQDLLTGTERTAAGFALLGVRKGDTVALQLGNCAEFVFAWFGLAWMGAIAVPANTANTVSEMRHIVSLSGAKALVAMPEVLGRLRQELADVPALQGWITARDGDDPERDVRGWLRNPSPDPHVLEGVAPDDVAELIFTSGTTSLPKGVMLTHANYLYSGEREARTVMLDGTDRLLTALPLFHVNAQSNTVLAALTLGATAIVLEEYSASRFWSQVRDHGATHVSLVAMHLRTLLSQPPRSADREHSVRRTVYAINVSSEEKELFEERFGVELLNGYGLSEAMTVVTMAPPFGDRRWPSIGLPAVGREVRIVDDDGADLPPGRVGELIVRGVPGRSIMKGYFGDPAATAEALRGDWLYTGDKASHDEQGYIYFVDRSKDIIKRAGENISSSEVERVLITHPAVREAAVVGVPDPIRDEAVKAFLVLEPGHNVTADELVRFCTNVLAKFKVPTEYAFIEAMPKTSVGKIQKRMLKEFSGD